MMIWTTMMRTGRDPSVNPEDRVLERQISVTLSALLEAAIETADWCRYRDARTVIEPVDVIKGLKYETHHFLDRPDLEERIERWLHDEENLVVQLQDQGSSEMNYSDSSSSDSSSTQLSSDSSLDGASVVPSNDDSESMNSDSYDPTKIPDGYDLGRFEEIATIESGWDTYIPATDLAGVLYRAVNRTIRELEN